MKITNSFYTKKTRYKYVSRTSKGNIVKFSKIKLGWLRGHRWESVGGAGEKLSLFGTI